VIGDPHELYELTGELPDLGRPAIVQDHDPVGRPDRGQAVRDHDRGPVQGQAEQRLLNQPLGLGVDR